MSPLYLENVSVIVFNKLIAYLNKELKLNSNNFDDILIHLQDDDYALVVQYRDVYNFLFKNCDCKRVNIKTFSAILSKATSLGVEVLLEDD